MCVRGVCKGNVYTGMHVHGDVCVPRDMCVCVHRHVCARVCVCVQGTDVCA